jgi:hypothetical protein
LHGTLEGGGGWTKRNKTCAPNLPPNPSTQHPCPTGKHFCNTSEALASWKMGPWSQRGECHHSGQRSDGWNLKKWVFGRGISWIKVGRCPVLCHTMRDIKPCGGGWAPSSPSGGQATVRWPRAYDGWRWTRCDFLIFSLLSEQISQKTIVRLISSKMSIESTLNFAELRTARGATARQNRQ